MATTIRQASRHSIGGRRTVRVNHVKKANDDELIKSLRDHAF